MRASRLALLAVGVVIGMADTAPAIAQPWGPRVVLDDAAYTAFGRRDGLPDGPLLSLAVGNDGRLLLGTTDGARRLDGRQWVRLPSPREQPRSDVRAVLDRANGDRVQVSPFSVHLQRRGAWIRHSRFVDSLGPIYSVALFPGPDGAETVYIGAAKGVFLVGATGVVQPVPLPPEMPPFDAMLTVHRERDTLELWVGTRGGGIARRRGDTWQRWGRAQGLTNMDVEQVVLAPPGDTARAIAATENGAFLLVGERWHAIGPRESIARALRVPVRGRVETWLGTLGGELLRSRDDVHFDAIDVASRIRGSRVQVLTHYDLDADEPVVYAGFRSGVLLRFRIGVAGRVLLPAPYQGRPVTALAPHLDDGAVWTWMLGVGAVRLPDLTTVPIDLDVIGGGDGRIRLLRAPHHGPLLASSEWRVHEARGTKWFERFSTGNGGYVHRLVELPTASGDTDVIALANAGAYRRTARGGWTPWRGAPTGLRALVYDTLGPTPVLRAILPDRSLWTRADDGWRRTDRDAMPLNGGPAAALTWRLRGGECVLLVGLSDGLAMRRTCGGAPAWRSFTESTLPGLPNNEIMDLAQLPDGRIAAATNRGLVVLRAGARFVDGLTVERTFTDADGLPHASINGIGPLDAQERLWLGTALGAGYVNMGLRVDRRRPPRVVELRLQDARGTVLDDEAEVPAHIDRVDAEAIVLTQHREDETRFRFLLDDAVMHPTAWIDRGTISMAGLSPGPHVLRVQASDFDGRLTSTVERRFRVVLPLWRRPLAYLAYAAFAVLVIARWSQVRAARARRRIAAAEANEQRLAASELRFRRLFEAGTAPQLLVVGQDVRQANAAATALLGGATAGLEGVPIDALVPDMMRTLGNDDGAWEGDARARDGTSIPVEVRRSRISMEHGTLDHIELVDLREQRRAEAERSALEGRLRESQRLESVGTLAGGVAHDFNNLLTVIHSNAEMAAMDVSAQSEAGVALTQLLTASTRAREVVRQILTFSRRTETRRTDVAVDALLAETQSLLRATIPSTVRFIVHVDAHDAVVQGDPTQLQQLLLNLCSNAEYAMRATGGGTLTVSATWRDDARLPLHLRVADNGSGMSDDVRARMFEPFFTTKPVGEGTGLGLSVLHGIVGAHGGDIQVHSEAGRGTTVDVFLPARRAARGGLPISEPTPAPVEGAPHLLLVDDDEAVRRSIARLLVREGFRVDVATNGVEALDVLGAIRDVALVITDQTMPMMTGTELAERMRRAGIDIPVVLASGYGAAIDGMRLAHLTNVHRLDKPFETRELLATIARALAERNTTG